MMNEKLQDRFRFGKTSKNYLSKMFNMGFSWLFGFGSVLILGEQQYLGTPVIVSQNLTL